MAEFIANHIGELAALTTSVLWATTSTFFTIGGRGVGSVVLNRTRLLLAIFLLLLAHLVLRQPLPTDISLDRVLWLSISGVIGLTVGDALLFQALVLVGPRISMLMMSLAPVIGAALAWIFLGERLSGVQILGISLTIGGIVWVVAERTGRAETQIDRRKYLIGVLFALGGATGQALGLVTAKQGLSGGFPALSGTLVRMFAAAVVLWMVTAFQHKVKETFTQLRDHPRAFKFILLGSITGPTLGVTFSLIAVQNTTVGVASTLMSLPPVLLLPVGHYVFGERFGWQAVAGTLVAISGVALLFLV